MLYTASQLNRWKINLTLKSSHGKQNKTNNSVITVSELSLRTIIGCIVRPVNQGLEAIKEILLDLPKNTLDGQYSKLSLTLSIFGKASIRLA